MSKGKIIMIGGVILLLIIVGVVALFLANRDKPNDGGTDEKIKIVYWGLWEPETVMQTLIDRYEREHTNIDIMYVQKPFTQYEGTVYTRLSQTVTEDTPAPDVIRINNTWLSKFQPYLSPLPSTVMTPAEYSTEFYNTAVKDFTGTDGEIYAIPLEIDGLALFYNTKLLKSINITEPPTDWDTFIEVAKKLTKKNSSGKITQAGVAMGSATNIKHSADIFNMLLLQNEVSVISLDGKTVSLDSTRAQSTMQWYIDYVKVHKVWSEDLASDLELFYSGKLAMMFAPSWRAFDILNSNSEIEFDIAPIPQVPNNNPVNYSMYWGEAVSKSSKNQIEAWKFVEWLSESTQLKEMYSNSSKIRAFGEPYSRKSLGAEIGDDKYVGAFIEMAPTMKAWKMGEQGFIEESLRTAINDIVVGDKEIATALKDAQERINAKLATSIQ